MADTKTTGLSAFTPILTDLGYGVDDPGGTPISGKFTFADVRTLLQANLTTATITVAAANTAALASTGYSLTGSDATSMIDLAGTWNTTGTPTALKLNITDTASNAASLLQDWQLNGVSVAKMKKDGTLTIEGGTYNLCGLEFVNPGGASRAALWCDVNNEISMRLSSGVPYTFRTSGLTLRSSIYMGWAIDQSNNSEADTRLWRDAISVIAQRNGTAAQAFRVYSTWTDASNGSWMTLDAAKTTANVNRIISNANGTGTIRPIAIDGFTKSGAPTSTEIPAGTFGVFKDSGGGVVIAYNDGGSIVTAALT